MRKRKSPLMRKMDRFQAKLLKSIEPDLKALMFPKLSNCWREIINKTI